MAHVSPIRNRAFDGYCPASSRAAMVRTGQVAWRTIFLSRGPKDQPPPAPQSGGGDDAEAGVSDFYFNHHLRELQARLADNHLFSR